MLTYKKGDGVLNDLMKKLPVELHIPGYQYCGPGTKLQERLARGDPGINPLDAACREHDIAYSKNRDNLKERHIADKILAKQAFQRVLAPDASFGEKAAAFAVSNIISAKEKMGMTLRKNIHKKKKGMTLRGGKNIGVKRGMGCSCSKGHALKTKLKKTAFRKIIDAAKKAMDPKVDAIKTALIGAKKAIKLAGGKHKIRMPRIIPVPKVGGVLPFLIPLFAGLSAVGGLAGGAATITKAVNAANAAKQELAEAKRHNEMMESIALGKGLYLKPYRTGLGLEFPKN